MVEGIFGISEIKGGNFLMIEGIYCDAGTASMLFVLGDTGLATSG